MELRSGKRMKHPAPVAEEPPFEPSGFSPIEAILPDDVLMLVFQQLERQSDWEALSLVSKRWCQLAASACTKLRVTRRAAGQRMAQVLRRFGPGLQTLDLGSAPFVLDADLRTLPFLCPNLTSITLSWQDSFSDEGLCALAQACGPRLLELSLSRCQGLSFRGIAAACAFLPNLQLLDLSHILGKAKVAEVRSSALAAYDLENAPKLLRNPGTGTRKFSDRESAVSAVLFKGFEIEQPSSDPEAARYDWEVRFGVGTSSLFDGARMRQGLDVASNGYYKKGESSADIGDVDSAIGAIAQSCRNLQTLLLKDCAVSALTDKGLEGLAAGQCAGSLTALDLAFCETVTDKGLRNLVETCTKLQELSLACVRLTSANKVTPAGIVHLFKQCPGMMSLDMSGNTLGHEWFRHLGLHATGLVRLNLNRCRTESDQPYLPVWKMCLNGATKFTLTHLNLMECTALEDLSLGMLAVSCAGLRVLKVSGCSEVTDRGLHELGRRLGGQLEELVLRGTGIGDTGKESFRLGAPWPKLHSLTVSQCEWVEDEALQSIAVHCSALTFLEAGDCYDVSGEGFSEILIHCKKLEKLMLYRNPGIQTLSLGDTCPTLRELDVSGCALRIGPLRTLASRCPNLEYIDMSGNRHLEGEGLRALVGGCLQLAVMDIQDCPKVTDKAVGLALKNSRSLKKVFVTRIKLGQRLETLGKKLGCKIICC